MKKTLKYQELVEKEIELPIYRKSHYENIQEFFYKIDSDDVNFYITRISISKSKQRSYECNFIVEKEYTGSVITVFDGGHIKDYEVCTKEEFDNALQEFINSLNDASKT